MNAKTALHEKISQHPAILQFIADPCSGQFLKDQERLSSYPNVKSGSVIIVMLQQWQIDVKVQINTENKVYKIKIPSDQDPEVIFLNNVIFVYFHLLKIYPIAKFKMLVEKETGYKIKQRKMLVFKRKELKDGTLGSWGIKNRAVVFLKEISKPEVRHCVFVYSY